MPGLPFGAAQTYDVPAEFRTYEHVIGIEFIEINPDKPYPRSAAYRPTENGGQMRIRDNEPDVFDVGLTQEEAQAYIETLAQSGLFEWQRVYRPAQGTFVIADVEWRVEVEFDTVVAGKRVKSFKVEGENTYPDNFEEIIKLLMRRQSVDES